MAIATFIPQLWSARLLAGLEKSHVATQLVNRNYEGLITQQGDTVHINTIGDISVSDYTRNQKLPDPQQLSTEDQTLTIDQAKYFDFYVDDVDKVQSAGDMVDVAMQKAAYKLRDAADSYLLSTIAAGAVKANIIGSTTAVALTSANVYENMVALATVLNKANVQNDGRAVVVPPDVYALLLQDERFTRASDAATANDVILNGEVGRVAGMKVFMSNNAVVDSKSVYTVTALVPYSTTFAEQIVSTEALRSEAYYGDRVRGLHVYGAKVTDGNAIAALKCTV